MVMIWHFLVTLKIQRSIYSSTSTKIMPRCPPQCHCCLPHLFGHPWMAHLRSPSQLSITERRSTLPMNWKSISNFQQKISRLVTQFSGGWANKVNFHTSFSWRVIFYAFLVSILTILIHVTWIWIVDVRFCCCCWKDILRWAGHHLSPMCQSPSQHNLYTHGCQEVPSPCPFQGQSWPQVLDLGMRGESIVENKLLGKIHCTLCYCSTSKIKHVQSLHPMVQTHWIHLPQQSMSKVLPQHWVYIPSSAIYHMTAIFEPIPFLLGVCWPGLMDSGRCFCSRHMTIYLYGHTCTTDSAHPYLWW